MKEVAMKRKSKIIPIILSSIVLAGIAGYFIIGNPVVFINNQKLKKSIKSIDNGTVQLNDVIPFYWDTVYTFEPYQSKESIEEIIGFKSFNIKENNINEGMVHLLFVNNNKVVASILGYDSNLTYRINFASKVTFAENASFNVTKADGITTLDYIK